MRILFILIICISSISLFANEEDIVTIYINGRKKTLDMEGKSDSEKAAMFIDYWNGTGAYAAMPEKMQQQFNKEIHKVLMDFNSESDYFLIQKINI